MTNIFSAFLLTSVIGTALAMILTLLKPITRKVFSASWHYYMWLVVLFVMVLPIRLNLPEKPVTTPPVLETVTITDNQTENSKTPVIIDTQTELITPEQPIQHEKVSTVQTIKDFLSGKVLLFSYIWLIGAILLFLLKITGYIIFNVKIHKNSEIFDCPEVKSYTNRKIKTRISDTICSPLMIGIIKPTLILPKMEMTDEQMHNVLLHEMTHLKRNDILYKWIVSFVKCIHWFNPAIYYIARQVNIDCEISCDMLVVREMSDVQEKSYVETILSLLTNNNKKAIPLTTGMAGDKNTLKKRFTMIKNKIKISKKVTIISVIIAIAIGAVSIFISGILATDILKTEENETTNYIELRDNNVLIHLKNKPFYKNEVIYLPLDEFFEKTGLAGEDGIIKEGNRITLNLLEYDNNIKLNYCYGFEIGKSGYIINPEGSPMHSSENPLYKEHTNIKQKTKSFSVLHNDLIYIPFEYIEYMVNKVMQTHNITIFDLTDLKNSITDIDNAENMSFEDIRSLQLSVDNGHFPWRLDPAQVISSFISKKGETVSRIRIPEIKTDKLDYEDDKFKISLFKPIDKTQKGIWIVKSYTKKKNIELSTVIWPCESKTISQSFGKRVHPITGEEKVHNGVDIKADENSIVVSSISGKVTDTGYDNEFGNFIVIENNIGIKVKYAHLSEILVKKGNTVSQKDIIGRAGKTGIATGPQLHFEVQMNGEYVNPERFLNTKKDIRSIKEIFFYERTPEQAMIEKQEDGWYKVPQQISAFFQYEGKTPHSVFAYFTPTGTGMESKKRLIGKTDTSIYQTKANVLSMDINFSEEDTLGHLWFEFEYENGEKISTEYFKVYRKALGDPPYKTTKSSDSSDIVLSHSTLSKEMNSDILETQLKRLGISYSDSELTDLKKSFTKGECRGGMYSLVDNENVMCDENGNITLFFDDSDKDYIDITFTDCYTGKVVAEYGVLSDNSKSYSFMGFDKGRIYNVVMLPQTNNSEKRIKYTIY